MANAGAGRRHGWLDRLERLCLAAHVALVKTASPREARRVAGGAARAGCGRVIAAGGDGTAHHVLNALAGTESALGIIPLGTANDFARALGIPLDFESAAELALRGPIRRIDLGRVGGSFFGSVATFGLGANANRRANRLHFGGGFKYSYALLRALIAYRPPRVIVQSDGHEWQGELMVGLVGNADSYGGGMKVTPRALVDDGLLDVCLVSRMSPLKLLACFPQVFSGTHLEHREVSYFQTRRLCLESEPPVEVFADGECVARAPVEFEIVPSCLNVVGPGC